MWNVHFEFFGILCAINPKRTEERGGSWNQHPGLYGIKIILVLKFVKDAADLIKSLEEIKFLIFTYFILSCNIIMNHSITED